jgi:hypothetical protein
MAQTNLTTRIATYKNHCGNCEDDEDRRLVGGKTGILDSRKFLLQIQ